MAIQSGIGVSASSASHQITRRYELDWLRACAVFGLIPFHVAIVFSTGSGDYVKNAETSYAVDFLVSLISPWGMALIFLVGGASACFALQSRSPRAYITERLSRLLIPFLFGLLVIVPIQVYIGEVYRLGAAPSFFLFYAGHIGGLLRMPVEGLPATGTDWIGHLWFIPILIVFALLAMPFDWLLRRVVRPSANRGMRAERLQGRLQPLALLLLIGLPVGAILFVFQASASQAPVLQALSTWALFATFLYFFFAGYVIYRTPALTHGIRDAAIAALLLATASLIALEVINRTHHAPTAAFTAAFALYCVLSGYVSWLWVAGFLGLGMRFLAFSPRWLPYMTEATYPAYIIHMPILSLIALYVVGWHAPVALKLVVIACVTGIMVLAVYDRAIKRIPLLRFLFGLKPLPAHAHPTDHSSAPPDSAAIISSSDMLVATGPARQQTLQTQNLLPCRT